jgi:hypothetical protein
MKTEVNLFNSKVLKLEYDFEWDDIKPIAKKLVSIENQDTLEINADTSYFKSNTHLLPELQPYYNFIKPFYTEYIFHYLNYPKTRDVEIQGSWFSNYHNQGFIQEHNHPESVAVAVIYIEKTDKMGNLLFKDPYYKNKMKYIRGNDDWLWNEVDVKSNDVIIFDANMWHKSQPNLTDDDRWILTTNIGFKERSLV